MLTTGQQCSGLGEDGGAQLRVAAPGMVYMAMPGRHCVLRCTAPIRSHSAVDRWATDAQQRASCRPRACPLPLAGWMFGRSTCAHLEGSCTTALLQVRREYFTPETVPEDFGGPGFPPKPK